MKLHTRVISVAVAFGMVVAIGLTYAMHRSAVAQDEPARTEKTVPGRGVVESASVIELRSDLPGQTAIRTIVADGSTVEEGDVLVKLDDSEALERIETQKIVVVQAGARLAATKADLEGIDEDSAAVIDVAKKELEVALLEKERLLGGGGELAHEIRTAKGRISIAKARIEMVDRLRRELSSDVRVAEEFQLAKLEAEESLATATSRVTMLEKFEKPYRVTTSELAISKSRLNLARSTREGKKAIQYKKAEVSAAEAGLKAETQKLKQLERQLALCKIVAPRAGTVLHANISTSRRGGEVVLQSGTRVRERQPIIRLVDLSKLRVRVFVPQTRIARVRVGQPATIEVDAFPDQKVQGKVIAVGRSPQRTNLFNANVVSFPVMVSLEDPPDGLKIGLTAVVTIQGSDQERD
jgi:multidrug resistance efflux pump